MSHTATLVWGRERERELYHSLLQNRIVDTTSEKQAIRRQLKLLPSPEILYLPAVTTCKIWIREVWHIMVMYVYSFFNSNMGNCIYSRGVIGAPKSVLSFKAITNLMVYVIHTIYYTCKSQTPRNAIKRWVNALGGLLVPYQSFFDCSKVQARFFTCQPSITPLYSLQAIAPKHQDGKK